MSEPAGTDGAALPPVAMVLTPVASAQALAGLCSMTGIDVHVVPSGSGAVAVLELDEKGRAVDDAAPDVPTDDDGGDDGDLQVRDWDISELLGGTHEEIPPQADELAKNLSRLSKSGVVLITAALSEEGFEKGLSGQLTARHYNDGEAGEEVAVGLILAGADDVVEDLILRRVRVTDVPGHERSGDIPRWRAARMFGKGLRRRKP